MPPAPGQIVDLGYRHEPQTFSVDLPAITIEGDRIAAGGILWDAETRQQLIGYPEAGALAGDRVVGESGLYDAVTGSLIAPFAGTTRYGIAYAGSYAYYVDANGIHVVDADGNALLDWPGNYSGARIFPQPSELLIALGPAGSNLIERVSLVGTQTITPAFTGTFHSWFGDGERFLTTTGTNVRVYSKAAVQEQLALLNTTANLGGRGDNFWTFASSQLTVYQVGAAQPVWDTYFFNAVGAKLVSTPGGLGLLRTPLSNDPSTLELIVPQGAMVQSTTYDYGFTGALAFGATPDGRWVVGTNEGVVIRHGTLLDPQDEGLLGCGKALAISGTTSGHVAISTGSGKVLVYSVDSSGVATLDHILPTTVLNDMQLSDDGSKLLARAATFSGPVPLGAPSGLWDVASGTLLLPNVPAPFDYADAGGVIGTQQLGVGNETDLDAFWSGSVSTEAFPCVSPAGNGDFVVPNDSGGNLQACTTTFFVGGNPTNVVSGCASGWLNPDRVMVQTFMINGPTNYPVASATIYDASGNAIGPSPFTISYSYWDSSSFCSIEPVDATTVFLKTKNDVIDWTTGTVLHNGPPLSAELATRVGNFVVNVVDAKVSLVDY